MDDIAPQMYDDIMARFEYHKKNNHTIERCVKRLANGTATYEDGYFHANATGACMSDAFMDVITQDKLPNGHMYYNIAERTVRPALEHVGEIEGEYSNGVQQILNDQYGIGLKPVKPNEKTTGVTRIEGIIDRLTDAEYFDDIRWILGDGVIENYAQSIIDAHIQANFEYQSKAGLPTSTTRNIGDRKACAWCRERQGRYTSDNIPQGFWQRHENCKCIITYIPKDGQTIETHKGTGKAWVMVDKQILNERKTVNLDRYRPTASVLEARKIFGLGD